MNSGNGCESEVRRYYRDREDARKVSAVSMKEKKWKYPM